MSIIGWSLTTSPTSVLLEYTQLAIASCLRTVNQVEKAFNVMLL